MERKGIKMVYICGNVLQNEIRKGYLCGNYAVFSVSFPFLCIGLMKWIHPDQTGFVSKRRIRENIRCVLNIISKRNQKNKQAALISLDAEKAFDNLEWSFTLATSGGGKKMNCNSYFYLIKNKETN